MILTNNMTQSLHNTDCYCQLSPDTYGPYAHFKIKKQLVRKLSANANSFHPLCLVRKINVKNVNSMVTLGARGFSSSQEERRKGESAMPADVVARCRGKQFMQRKKIPLASRV